MWPVGRCVQVFISPNNCALCNRQVTHQWHTYWTCPFSEFIRDSELAEPIQHTQYIIDHASPHYADYYDRAVITRDMVDTPAGFEPLQEALVMASMCRSDAPPVPEFWSSGY